MGIDFQHVMELMPDITKAFGETLYMIGISSRYRTCYWACHLEFYCSPPIKDYF